MAAINGCGFFFPPNQIGGREGGFIFSQPDPQLSFTWGGGGVDSDRRGAIFSGIVASCSVFSLLPLRKTY